MRFLIMLTLVLISISSLVAFGQAEEAAKTNWLQDIPMYIEVLSQVVFALIIGATALTRVIPGKKDDVAVSKVASKVHKYLGYLPTFGVNPRTKELEAALAELQKQANEKK